MNSHQQRRRIFIDRPLQVAVLFRAFLYWAVCLLAQLLMAFFLATVTSTGDDFSTKGPQLWWHLQISLFAAVVLLPIVLLDILKLSHRWAGPIFRLRTCLHALGRGESVPPIRFRDRDFWQELAGDFNVVAAELHRRRVAAPEESVTGSIHPAQEDLPTHGAKPTQATAI